MFQVRLALFSHQPRCNNILGETMHDWGEGTVQLPRHAHRYIPILSAVVATGIFFSAHAARADDGDEMCSKKGKLLVDDVETRSWENTGAECTPKGPNGPSNGDRKCGVSGFTVKYVAKIDRWENTHSACQGALPTGAHLENLHTGTER
jgi:hypothetical protein